MAEKYPWAKIRHEYITGGLSYGQLAEKHGINRVRTIQDRASEENWVELRKAYRQTVTQKAAGKAATRASKALARSKLAADKCMDKLNLLLDQTDPEDPEKPMMLASKEVRELVSSLKDLVAIQRDLYDIPTDGERWNRFVQAEKLSLEEQRIAAGLPEADGEETGVVILPEVGV